MGQQRSASFANRVAVVTGAAAGLGAALARQLVAAGAKVVVADLRGDRAAEVAAEIGAESAAVDVANAEQVGDLLRATKAKYGSLDLMINNAGILIGGDPLELPFEQWQRVMDVNLMGVISGSLEALRIMAQQGSGQILNIASVSGLALSPMLGAYSASKAGAVMFSRGLAEEARAYGVHVALACPGNMRTALAPAHVTWLMPPMEPEYAAQRILRYMYQGKRTMVFPFYARLWWWVERLNPELLRPFRQVIVRRARARQAAATGPQ